MAEKMMTWQLHAVASGLKRVGDVYIDLRKAEGGAESIYAVVERLMEGVKNVQAFYQETVYMPVIEDGQFHESRYVGHRITLSWSRAVKPGEQIADVEAESLQALEAAVKALIAAGYEHMPYPSENPAVVQPVS